MLIGYARVSTVEQDTALQVDALRRAGVDRLLQEKMSGVGSRVQLERMLYLLKRGDVVLVYRIDRVARSLVDLLRILERITAAGASFRSLSEPIETATPVGRMILQMLGAVAEFERSLIRDRSMAGQLSAYRRGACIGRPRALTAAQAAECLRKWSTGRHSKSELARLYGVHLSSIKRVILRVEKPDSPAVRLTMPKLLDQLSDEKKPAVAGSSLPGRK